ncbi:MAG: hypothetical protein QW416_08380 [Candidatus Nitrosocaldaceae archaeon]
MSSMLYYNKVVTDIGIMGFGFKINGKKIWSLQWLKDTNNDKYIIVEREIDDILLHHTITAVTGTNVDSLSRLLEQVAR